MTSELNRFVAAAALVALAASTPAFAAPKEWSGQPGGPGNPGGGSGGSTAMLSFSADQTEYVVGDTALLSWASVGTKFCNASGDWSGKFDVEGVFRTPPLDGPKTYTLKCNSSGGGVSETVNVAVVQPASSTLPAPAPTVSLQASAGSVVAGDNVTLSWTSTDVDGCTASGAWSGSYGPSGSVSVGPLDTDATFALSCSGTGGTTMDSVSVAVSQPVEPTPAPTVSLQSSSGTVVAGDNVTLSWTSADADGCIAGGGWAGSYGASGSATVGPLDVDTTFALSCSGTGGTATDSVTVAVTEPTPAPVVQLSASPTTVTSGSSVTLTWTADNADSCSATGGWSGAHAASGSETTGALTASTTFGLSCSGAGGTSETSTSVTVTAPPEPTLSFSSADSVVASGGSTTLSWTATDADGCTASGGWSGTKSVSGTEAVGPLSASTTFSLSCTGAGGSVVQMLSISAMGTVTVSWAAPTENVDGTPLTDLAGYRIYYGAESRNYTGTISVNDPAATSHSFPAQSGDYFVGMTALDAGGNESAISNEVLKTVP